MYYQDVVCSPDILECIKNFFSGDGNPINFKDYVENLKNKKLILDKDNSGCSVIEKEYNNIKENSSDFVKNRIESILKSFLLSNKQEYKTLINKEEYDTDFIVNMLLNLAKQTESKIINSEKPELKSIIENSPELKEIEVLDIEEFIDPPSTSKVAALNKTIHKRKGEYFKFEEFLHPYLCDTKTITINCKYLRMNPQFTNLKRLLNLCNSVQKIIIKTELRDDGHQNFDINIDDFKNVLINEFGDKFEFQGTRDRNRFINTEKYNINIQHCFDFVNRDYLVYKEPVTLTIQFISR